MTFSKEKQKLILLFIVMCLIIFIKCVAFNWLYFHSILVSSLFTEPLEFIKFYTNKLLPGLLISSFLFVWKRKGWSVIIQFIIDLWIIANLVYYRANGLLLDMSAILMTTNLKGFGSSILAYLHFSYLLFPFLSIIYLYCYKKWNNKFTCIPFFLFILLISVLYHCLFLCGHQYKSFQSQREAIKFDIKADRKEVMDIYGRTGLRVFVPFHEVALFARPGFSICPSYAEEYTRSHSIIHLFPAMIVYYINLEKESEAVVSDSEVAPFFADVNQVPVPNCNLILVLVESLESWPLENEELSRIVCPNLMALRSEHSAYFSKVRSMAKHGVSGDGQMMLLSGMLPIFSGAACILYGNNEWPGIPHLYQNSLLVDSANGIWNQHQMTGKYGFCSYDESDQGYNDEELFSHLSSAIDTISSPYCLLTITGATHSPFNHVPDSGLMLPKGMPQYLHDYLVCLNYTDKCIGTLLEKYKTDPKMSDAAIVITGDHNVFKPSLWREFSSWDRAKEYQLPSEESFCPLIICSKHIEQQACEDIVYQMDLFPTVLSLIGCKDYFWKGFGVDLLDKESRQSRPISVDEAIDLSDRMIRSNYFQHFSN